jgi:cell division protein FtsB
MAWKQNDPRENDRVIDINEVRDEKQARRSFVTGSRLIIVVAVIVIAILGVRSVYDIRGLRDNAASAKKELQLKEEEKANLEVELGRLRDPEYIEKQVREQLRMVKSNEIIYIYKDDESGTPAAAAPVSGEAAAKEAAETDSAKGKNSE